MIDKSSLTILAKLAHEWDWRKPKFIQDDEFRDDFKICWKLFSDQFVPPTDVALGQLKDFLEKSNRKLTLLIPGLIDKISTSSPENSRIIKEDALNLAANKFELWMIAGLFEGEVRSEMP